MTAILSPNNKKRDRLNMTSSSTTTSSSSSQSQQEEYEAALSFLRDFHSKQVSSGDMILHSLHSPSEQLDAIIESSTDGNGGSTVEDVLSSDFSLALSVGRSSESSLASSTLSSCDVSQPSHSTPQQQQRRGHKERRRIMPSTINLSPTLPSHQHQPQTPITSNKRSRMKKCSTSECLLDLLSNDTPTTPPPSFPTLSKRNEGIYTNYSYPSRSSRCPPSPTRYEEGRDEYSHYLDLGGGSSQHVAKCHRM